jgi:hypothetical protein
VGGHGDRLPGQLRSAPQFDRREEAVRVGVQEAHPPSVPPTSDTAGQQQPDRGDVKDSQQRVREHSLGPSKNAVFDNGAVDMLRIVINDATILQAAEVRRDQALRILERMDLLGRWSTIGNVELVGSVALNVVVKPDIDLAVFVDDLSPRRGFAALVPLTDDLTVEEITYVDARRQPINGLYWKMLVAEDDEPWTIDTWMLTRDREQDGEEDVRRATRLQARAINQRPEARATIIRIKHEARARGQLVHGRWLYEAVLDGGVKTYDEHVKWMGSQDARERSTWIPHDCR